MERNVRYVPCCVPGCKNKNSRRHRFPHPCKDEERFKKWLQIINNNKLKGMQSMRIYNNYRVCHMHFTPQDECRNNYLNKVTVPSKNISIDAAEELEVLPSTSSVDELEVLPSTSSVDELLVQPSTSTLQEARCDSPLPNACAVRLKNMTPLTRRLYTENRNLRSASYIYKSRLLNLKKRLHLARNMQNLYNSGLRREAFEFCIQQLNRKITKPKGRRYSTNDKLLSLSLYKTSGAAYRFLAQWFNLPSKSTILRLLSKIPIGEGFNNTIINNIHSSIRLLRPVDRLCVVVFDEIVLSPGIHYSSTRDVMVGVTNGNIVKYALVFLLRGITKKWKQTVCYSFSKGPATAHRIKDQLVTLIKKLNGVNGLRIVATVCDQVSANRSAIEDLVDMGVASDVANNRPLKRRILVNGEDIIPLYDVPHILKGIRNNLLTKNLVWKRQDDIVEARWRDIVAAYKIDTQSIIRLLPKITECHVTPNKIKKMKVSYAAQVLSHSMAAAINIMARHNETDITGEFYMDSKSSGTAMIIKEFDEIFDSLNGEGRKYDALKPLTGPITRRSSHAKYWKLAIKKLNCMYYKNDAQQCCFPPSLKNLMLTIRGFIDLREKLFSLGVKSFFARQFNQDCLENFFGQVRQHRVRENKICAIQFEESFRSLLIKQITSKQSLAANCEDTFDETLIQLNHLLNSNTPQPNDDLSFNSNSKIDIIILASSSIINKQLKNFVIKLISRFVLQKLIPKFDCTNCTLHILKPAISRNRNIILNDYFLRCLCRSYNIARLVLYRCNVQSNVKSTIKHFIRKYVVFSFTCDHKNLVIDFLLDYLVLYAIRNFCRYLNDLMCGKRVRLLPTSCLLIKQCIAIRNSKYRKHCK